MYKFVYNAINPTTDSGNFQFNGSIDGGSNYNVNKTTSFFYARHDEANTTTALSYNSSYDGNSITGYQYLAPAIGSGADECGAGELYLFTPSNTTYVTLYTFNSQHYQKDNYSIWIFGGGYYNTTAAIDKLKFYMSSGVIEEGIIKMYGISKS